jgi:hypothetical protein
MQMTISNLPLGPPRARVVPSLSLHCLDNPVRHTLLIWRETKILRRADEGFVNSASLFELKIRRKEKDRTCNLLQVALPVYGRLYHGWHPVDRALLGW